MSHNEVQLREEQPGDEQAISAVIVAAFENHPHSNQSEQFIVSRLREREQLSVSIVATKGSQGVDKNKPEAIIGHISFSKVTINGIDGQYYGLAPVSVLPEYQKQGVGSLLINAGLEKIKAMGAKCCVLVGEPDYYQRFGFEHSSTIVYPELPEEYFMVLSFAEQLPEGKVDYQEAFID